MVESGHIHTSRFFDTILTRIPLELKHLNDSMKIWPGSSSPRGATWDGAGVNFALFSERATKVELCLFASPEGNQETARITAPEQTGQVWHVCLPDVRPGQLSSYMVTGFTALTSRRRVIVATQLSFCSIPMPKPSPAAFIGMIRSLVTP